MNKAVEAEIKALTRQSKLAQSKNPLKNILGAVERFEGGCSNSFGSGRPERCEECTRAFLRTVKAALKKGGVR